MTHPFKALALLVFFVLSGCVLLELRSSPPGVLDPSKKEGSLSPRAITVFAAASLSDAFQEIRTKFEAENPELRVNFSFAGSQVLRTQLEQGATADVYASADQNNMKMLIQAGLIEENSDQVFVRNRLVVIVPSGNPAELEALQDLGRPGMKIILADSSVPAGNYARQVLTRLSEDPRFGNGYYANVLANVVSNETDVKQVVTKVELGEADAGVVYVSDSVAVPELNTLLIPDEFNILAEYPIATLSRSPSPDAAELFIAYVLSPDGQAILGKWGFMMEHDR